jgi:ABC-2 type transport system ATP-binding protein
MTMFTGAERQETAGWCWEAVMWMDTQMEVASLREVTKNYGMHCALSGVNIDLRQGSILALLGPNGAGKTTAVKLLLGLLKPSNGSVHVFGLDPQNVKTRQRMGAMLQAASVPETLRVREHIDLFSTYYPHPLTMGETIARAGLEHVENRFFSDLSGGERRRLMFALAICGDPDLLFLDEPTTGLDIEARRSMWAQIRTLRAAGKTILLTTHYLEEADHLADRIVVLKGGKTAADGSPAEIKRLGQSDLIDEAFLNLTANQGVGR